MAVYMVDRELPGVTMDGSHQVAALGSHRCAAGWVNSIPTGHDVFCKKKPPEFDGQRRTNAAGEVGESEYPQGLLLLTQIGPWATSSHGNSCSPIKLIYLKNTVMRLRRICP